MKPLKEKEIFQNLSGFLKSRGIELKEGAYAQGIEKSCSLLTDAINLGQKSVERAKKGVEKTVTHLRQAIHEKTAPKPPPVVTAARSASPPPKAPARTKKGATTGSQTAQKKGKPRAKRS